MNKRDQEDMMMQGRETARGIMDEAMKELNEPDLKRAIGKMWATIPAEVKAKMAKDKPDVVKKMNEMYGGEKVEPVEPTAQHGNPWGVVQKGR